MQASRVSGGALVVMGTETAAVTRGLAGWLSEVALWPRELTAAEVLQRYRGRQGERGQRKIQSETGVEAREGHLLARVEAATRGPTLHTVLQR